MKRFAVSSVLALLAVLAFSPGAQAVGELTSGGCIDDNDSGNDVCAQAINGMSGSAHVAVSPDGRSVYVASVGDNALVRFNRASTGALTPAGCIDDNDDSDDVCAQSINGLQGANAVTVSPDGRSVYVASFGDDDAIVRFNRDVTGGLTPAGCIDDNDTGQDVCAQSVNGLAGANGVAVSPDGSSVYVASNQDSAVVRFNRASTGALTPGGCIDDNDDGPDVCAQSVNGLHGAVSVVVSPDGNSVYTASPTIFFDQRDDAIVRFNRSATGALTSGGCVDDNDTGLDLCSQSINGLTGVAELRLSPDGSSLYAASFVNDAIVRFDRSTTGVLIPAGCIDDNDSGQDVCAQSVDSLTGASSVAVSPDGNSVYVVSGDTVIVAGDDALVRFDRSTTGVLTPGGCIDDNDSGGDSCAQSVNGLGGVVSVSVSPDERSVYTVSFSDDAVVRFNRAT